MEYYVNSVRVLQILAGMYSKNCEAVYIVGYLKVIAHIAVIYYFLFHRAYNFLSFRI